jgi:hypothetical protein
MTRIPGEWRYFDDKLGIPYPWYTSTALKIIETWDFKGKKIWEYGVGDSTLWYRSRGASVNGVDNNLEWANKVGCKFAHFENEYVGQMAVGSVYDIICIDGVWRDECTEYALWHLKPGGFLIIDNYKQPSVQADWPKTEKLIEGMTAGFHKEPEHEDWVTAIIYKSK